MQINKDTLLKLKGLDKCIILLSYISEKNAGLFKSILSSLPSQYAEEIIQRLSNGPSFSKQDLTTVLSEINDICIQGTQVIPTQLLQKECETKLSTPNQIQSGPSATNRHLSSRALVNLIRTEPEYFIGLLYYFLPKEGFAKQLSELSKKDVQIGLNYIQKITPPNPSFLNELWGFYQHHINDTSHHECNDETHSSQTIAEILELMPGTQQNEFKEIIPASISWSVIESQLLTANDIQSLPADHQHKVLNQFGTPSELAEVLSIMNETVQSNLLKTCITSRQRNLIQDDLIRLKNNPLSQVTKDQVSSKVIQAIRQTINQQSAQGGF